MKKYETEYGTLIDFSINLDGTKKKLPYGLIEMWQRLFNTADVRFPDFEEENENDNKTTGL